MSDHFSIFRSPSQTTTLTQYREKTPLSNYNKINTYKKNPLSNILYSHLHSSRSNISSSTSSRPKREIGNSNDISFLKKSFLIKPQCSSNKSVFSLKDNANTLCDELTNRINEMINKKNENKNTNDTISQKKENEQQEDKDTKKEEKYAKMNEIKNILSFQREKKNKNDDTNEKRSIFENKLKSRYNIVKDIYPHVDMYDNVRLFNKSASCQRIDHMHRVINKELYGNNNTSFLKGNNDLFRLTNEGRIKTKIKEFYHFAIFPDYNARKIDVELKKVYAKNNLNIIGGIKDKFEQNKKEEEKETKEQIEKKKAEKQKEKEELDIDIDVDDLIN